MMCTNNLFRSVAKLKKHKPYHIIRKAFTTNNHEYTDCPYRLFAKTHPDIASELLKVPPHPTHNNTTPILSKDNKIEDYLSWRGWNIKGILLRHKLDNESTNSAAVGLLSHPLTFPLTLGRYISEMVSHDSNTNYEQKKDIRICCVGARAEATLPDEYWRELLIAAFVESSITIDFIGPDLPSNLTSSKTISLLNNNEDDHIQHSNNSKLTMNYHKSFLHDVILKLLKSLHEQKDTLQPAERTKKILNLWDGYVLFNPGIGHPNIQKGWIPTLKFLIETSKPILFTAHSTIDADRDSKVLEKMSMNDDEDGDSSDRAVEYKPNPYASRMKFVDPFPTSPNADDTSVHLVRPNDQIFLLNKR